MSSISVVIVTLNEEANIRRCLESAKWADEVIVVDSGSTDRTVEICREYGCRVLVHEWTGDGPQKAYAIEQATSNWVLVLDADEELTDALVSEIRETIESPTAADVFFLSRRNSFLGKWMGHGGWYPDRVARLFKREGARWSSKITHSHLDLARDTKTARLKNDLLHYTYPTLREFIRKADRFSTKQAEQVLAENRIPRRLRLRLITAFPRKFAETYIYKGGWRDGMHGFVASVLMATRVFMRYAKLWEQVMERNGRNGRQ